MKRQVVVCAIVLAGLLGASQKLGSQSSGPGTIHACVQKSSQQVRIVDNPAQCRSTETPVTWNTAGSPGPAGPTGAQGPEGPAGPAGPAGTTLLFNKRWDTASHHPCCGAWSTAAGSVTEAVTQSESLLIQMDLSLVGGSHGTCRPIIDGQWAGDFAGEPKPGDPYWTEGLTAVGCCGGGWRKWSTSRVYTNIPPGQHTFAVQCATDSGTLQMSGGPFSSWHVFEIK